jgi:hypothetical protein
MTGFTWVVVLAGDRNSNSLRSVESVTIILSLHITDEVVQQFPCFTIRRNEPKADAIRVVPNHFTSDDHEPSGCVLTCVRLLAA